jgi:hypothetical protein
MAGVNRLAFCLRIKLLAILEFVVKYTTKGFIRGKRRGAKNEAKESQDNDICLNGNIIFKRLFYRC